ncbi:MULTISPECIES: nickel transporter permease [Variovorax]|jgi:peptide/nickel transport system permease protein|uniref:nickel transporter permease n=1 Tax=Variovorax TaxID=34072 RepID=UPI00086E8BB8|nr:MULTISPECIES: nickel transporter permease [Variovorax]MBN8754132.1 ABC transporter permease [Variovorax sp.]ODU18436.1 MAG: D-ala-D-ala transporter subunit [Variovorax sp. SCN 67-85]ODV25130.1 MAG: D-ala-D-ala transporter subunit [Variovorax sp. SCN 67-20]OJZ04923.1 MAG: D-ala-D-ala transporter subunit [Variovorax sp. 67-131]UKI09164.1 ABC transporter permease [Variovorax paradoxus]
MMLRQDWWLSEAPASAFQARCGRWYRMGLRTVRSPAMVFGLVILAAMVLAALFAPWLAPFDPNAQNVQQRLLPPGAAHWLGTDQLGRDLLSRVIYGTRPTLLIVSLVALLSAPLGLLLGMCAGYFGGWIDTLLMRVTDIFMAFPRLVLALALVAVLGPGIVNAVIAIAITAWPAYARIARTETRTVRGSDFIQAARVQGLRPARILFGHLLPICLPSTVVRVTLDMAGIILTAAGLGFLGLGAQPPMSEWGAMISTGRQYIFDQWWVAAVPGVAILLGSLAFNLVGDGLRDVLDPKNG